MALNNPNTHQALVLENRESGFQLRHVPTPQATAGSLIIQVLAAGIVSYHREVYNGERSYYPFPTPFVGGYSAVGRVVEAGPDTTILNPGQLIFFDCTIRGRDDRSAAYLVGIHWGFSNGSHKLAKEVWHDGAFAEYMKVPLENCFALNEATLCQSLGYTVTDLMYLGTLLVPYGGLRDINVQAGDTVVLCPATGGFGGAGVLCAAMMGAKVIAMGRNEAELARLKSYMATGLPRSKIETVKITGDHELDTAALIAHGPIDGVLDLTPVSASKSTHLKSAVAALKPKGQVSLMGTNDLAVSDWKILAQDIVLKGKFMYDREDIVQLIKVLEKGMFPEAGNFVSTKTFPLADWKEALDAAAEWTGIGKGAVFTP